MALEIKNGKIKSRIRNKWLVLTPEERVRQEFADVLIELYKYDPRQIDEEIDVTGMYSLKRRPDFVIWRTIKDKEEQKTPFIIVECKADYVTINKKVYEQGEYYARTTDAPFFVTHNNSETKYWRVKKGKMPGHIEEIQDMPKAEASDKEIQDILSRLKVFKENEFADLLHQCHNIIRNREKLDPAAAFDEIAKVLFMKVYAERKLKADMEGNIFTHDYIEQGEKFNPDYLYDIFEKTKADFGKDKLFAKTEKINLRVSTIKSIVKKLEAYNLSATSTDVKGIAFEKFLGKTFRGEIGQFFTPRKVVEFMVDMVQPKEGDVICDPASGSGGFLIRFFEIVREQINFAIDEEYQNEKHLVEKQKGLTSEEKAKQLISISQKLAKELDSSRKHSRLWKLSNRYVYGVDANERMARTSKMNMIMHGDGHGGIHHHDGFLNVNGVFEERFDIILTNPPFGQSVDEEDEILPSQVEVDEDILEYYQEIYGNAYEESRSNLEENIGKPILSLFELPKGNSIKTELLFVERCLNLLKPGGRLGIVLPEGVFNTSSVQYVRDFLEDKAYVTAIISLPPDAFSSTGAKVKASILFAKKYTNTESNKWKDLVKSNLLKAKKKYANSLLEHSIKFKELSSEEKRDIQSKIKKIEETILIEARFNAKKEWDYPIYFHEALDIGINAQGEDVELNELPIVLRNYADFRKGKKFINLEMAERTFVSRYKDLSKWTIPTKLLLNLPNPHNWRMKKIKDIVCQSDEKEKVNPSKEYDMVGVKWYGEGLFHRETVLGAEISAKWLYPLIPGAFIYNRLFAWKVSFAVVDETFKGYYVSNEFPQFVMNDDFVLPEFLYFLFTQPEFVKAVKFSSGGSAAVSRNRFKEEDFLDFEIYLPPIAFQNKIMERYRQALGKAEKLRKEAETIIGRSKNEIRNSLIGL